MLKIKTDYDGELRWWCADESNGGGGAGSGSFPSLAALRDRTSLRFRELTPTPMNLGMRDGVILIERRDRAHYP
jgi:hypothetical protein